MRMMAMILLLLVLICMNSISATEVPIKLAHQPLRKGAGGNKHNTLNNETHSSFLLAAKVAQRPQLQQYTRRRTEEVNTYNEENNNAMTIDLIKPLRGRLGNWLCQLLACYVMKWTAESAYPDVKVRVLPAVPKNRVSEDTGKLMSKCFPRFSEQFDLNESYGREFQLLGAYQDGRYGKESFTVEDPAGRVFVEGLRLGFMQKLEKAVDLRRSIVNGTEPLPFYPSIGDYSTVRPPHLSAEGFDPDSGLHFPFLTIEGYRQNYRFYEPYREHLRELFRFDDKCCGSELPEANETVLHIRLFGNEIPGSAYKSGYRGADPKQAANYLLGHLRKGDKVAILSPYPYSARRYVEPLERRGLVVRVIRPMAPQETFCFLLKAHEIAGSSISTFFGMASFLGDQKSIHNTMFHTKDVSERFKTNAHQAEFGYYNEKFDERLQVHHFYQGGAV